MKATRVSVNLILVQFCVLMFLKYQNVRNRSKLTSNHNVTLKWPMAILGARPPCDSGDTVRGETSSWKQHPVFSDDVISA